MNFKEACEQVGYDPQFFNPPTKIYKYFAYKNGQSYECVSQEEASKISSLTEQVLANKDEIEQYTQNQNALLSNAIQIWKENLREEYSYISDHVYNVCYEKAYYSAHAYGYDEVASTLKDEIEFACKILNYVSD